MGREYNKLGHCVYYAKYHLVFCTKYRKKILKHGLGAYVLATMKRVNRKYPEVEIIEANTDIDHVHLFLSIPPKYPVSNVVGYIKGTSARAMRRKFNFLSHIYYGHDGIWSPGYFLSTVGVNEDTIRNYVKHQGEQDSGQAKLEL